MQKKILVVDESPKMLQFMNSLLENLESGVVVLTREGKIVGANSAAASLSGLPEVELLSRNLADLFHEEHREMVQSLLDSSENPSRAVSSDSPLAIDGKRVGVKVLTVGGDSSERIAILTEKAEATKAEERTIGSSGDAGRESIPIDKIVHDFNNLLTGIIGNVSLAKIYAERVEKARLRLEEAERGAFKARDLARQLLAAFQRN